MINKSLEKTPSPRLKFILEMGPLLVFFAANYRGDWLIKNVPFFYGFDKPLFPATALFMVAITLSLLASWIICRKIPFMPLISGIFVLFFGVLTLWLHNDVFIKMKPTLINSFFAMALFVGLWLKKPLLRYVFGGALQLEEEGWRKLTQRWAYFFVFLAVVNEVVWRNFSDNFWANFKVFGIMPITLLFVASQMPLLLKHSLTKK